MTPQLACRVHDGWVIGATIHSDHSGYYVLSYDFCKMFITELDTYAQDFLVKGLWENDVRKIFRSSCRSSPEEVADSLRAHLAPHGLIQVGRTCTFAVSVAVVHSYPTHFSARRSRRRCSACCAASCRTGTGTTPQWWRCCCSFSRNRAGRHSLVRCTARRPGAS